MTTPTCTCGDPGSDHMVHRQDGACYVDSDGEVRQSVAAALIAAGYTPPAVAAAVATGNMGRLVRATLPSQAPHAHAAVVRALTIRPGDKVAIGVAGHHPYPVEVLDELRSVWPDVTITVFADATALSRTTGDGEVLEQAPPSPPVGTLAGTAQPDSPAAGTNVGNVPPPGEGDPLVRDAAEAQYWIGILSRRSVADVEAITQLRDRVGALERRPAVLRVIRRRLRRWQ